jgi:N-acetylglucosamine transport system permease protein
MTVSERAVEELAGPSAPGASPANKADRKASVISHVVLTLWSILVILPLVWVFLSSW